MYDASLLVPLTFSVQHHHYAGGVLRAVSLFGISTMKDKDLAAKDVNFTPLVMLGPNSVPENILPSRGYFFWKGNCMM